MRYGNFFLWHSRPDYLPHLLGFKFMQPTDCIALAGCINGQSCHIKTRLAAVVWMPKVQKSLPVNI
jgi:hypothetical protein